MRTNAERILVVTQSQATRDLIASVLQSGGNEVVIATDPSAARDRLADDPALVLVDLGGRNGDALALCRALRARGEACPPLVALAAPEDEALLRAALDAGVDELLRTPLIPEEVAARVRALLSARAVRTDLTRRAGDLELLLDLTRRFASALDVETLLDDLVDRLGDALGVPRCSILLVDEDRRKAVVLAAREDRRLADIELDLDRYPEIEAVLDSRRPLVIESAATHPLLGPVREVLEAQGVGPLAIFPLPVEERVRGVLFLRAPEARGAFTEREVQFAETVALATAAALRNARLFERITRESRRAERRLEHLKRYQELYEHVGEGILLVDADGSIEGANPAARRLLGDPDRLEGTRLSGLGLEPADRDRLEQLAASLWVPHPTGELEVSVAGPDGARRILALGASPLGDGAAVLTLWDVSRARRVEEKLRKTSEFLENLIDSSADAIISADMRGRIILWNRAAERITGWAPEVAVGGLHVAALYPEGMAPEIMRRLRASDNGGPGRVENMRVEIVARSGERIPVSMSAAILYEKGREIATMGIFTDLRERLKMERKLSAARDRLLRSEKQVMLAQLAGTAAHELNQPLTSIMGYTEILRHKLPPEDPNARAVEIIFRESERMAGIVRKIGRITRYETKEYLGNTRIVDLDRSSEDE